MLQILTSSLEKESWEASLNSKGEDASELSLEVEENIALPSTIKDSVVFDGSRFESLRK